MREVITTKTGNIDFSWTPQAMSITRSEKAGLATDDETQPQVLITTLLSDIAQELMSRQEEMAVAGRQPFSIKALSLYQ